MKKFAFFFLLFLTGIAAGLYVFWQRATHLPAWYTTNQPPAQAQQLTLGQMQRRLGSRIRDDIQTQRQTNPNGPVQIQLAEQDLNNLVASAVTTVAGGRKLPPAVKGLNTKVDQGKIEAGMVVNLSQLEQEITGEDRQIVAELVNRFPVLQNRELYVGLEGKPIVQNGEVQLDANSRVKVGELSFSLGEVADRLGVTPDTLTGQLNRYLQSQNVQLDDITVQNGNVVIRGNIVN